MPKAKQTKFRFLFAPGAGAPSSSEWMQDFAQRFSRLGQVECFDYPYQLAGRKSPDPQPKLIAAHRAALDRLRSESESDVPIVFIGKSMGGRIGCHVAVELGQTAPQALVCLGYPLIGGGRMRDEVLVALRTPILFVQGTRDPMGPIDKLEQVRERMKAPNHLHLVEGGDHSLRVTATQLRASRLSQNDVFDGVVGAIERFLDELNKTS